MGGRGNNRNNSNSFYNSSKSSGRNSAYENRSQPAHTSQSTSNNSYSVGRGNGNFQSRPTFWQNSYSNAGGYPSSPSWGRQNTNNNPQWARNNYRPQRPVSWDQTPQHRSPNPPTSWNSGAPASPTLPGPVSTFRFDQVPFDMLPPPPPPPLAAVVPKLGSNRHSALVTSKEGSSSSSVINPPLGSKEDRELRLEVAKTLVKKSLEESKDEESCKSTTPTSSSASSSIGLVKKKVMKPKSTKPNEGNSHHKKTVSSPVDPASDHNIIKTSSAAPISEEQSKRRLSLESNCILSSDSSKSTSKPTTPKRNRSNSLSLCGIPKTPEITTPIEPQNIKQRIIRELLGMSKNTLKEIISNPRSRKFEHVMKYMMKESRWKQSQIQRQVAQAGIDSPSEGLNCELVQRDYEDLLSDPDLAINLSNLPSEMIETLGNIFNLGSVSREQTDSSVDINLDSDDIACLFDSNSPSYVKQIPFVDLSSPVPTPKINSEEKDCPEDQNKKKIFRHLLLEDDTNLPLPNNQDEEADEISNHPLMESTHVNEEPPQRKSPKTSPDFFVSKKIFTFSSQNVQDLKANEILNIPAVECTTVTKEPSHHKSPESYPDMFESNKITAFSPQNDQNVKADGLPLVTEYMVTEESSRKHESPESSPDLFQSNKITAFSPQNDQNVKADELPLVTEYMVTEESSRKHESPESSPDLFHSNKITTSSPQNDQNVKADELPLVSGYMVTEESPRKSHEPSPDLYVNKITTLAAKTTCQADDSEKIIFGNDSMSVESESAEEAVLRLSRPGMDNFPMPLCQDGVDSIGESITNKLKDNKTKQDIQKLPLAEEHCASPSGIASLAGLNEAEQDDEPQTPSAVDEASLTNKDPMFSTQSDSPTIDEEFTTYQCRTKKDSENNLDSEDGFNSQLVMDEPLMSPDSFNGANINNNDIMTMKTIGTVEPDESVNFFENSEKNTDQSNQASTPNSDELESTSNPRDLECPYTKGSDLDCQKNVVNDDPKVCTDDSLQSRLMQQTGKVEVSEATAKVSEAAVEVLEATENISISVQLLPHSGSPAVLAIKREVAPLKIQEPTISSKALSGIEIGIQTETPVDNTTCFIGANDIDSIVKFLESSSLPGIDYVKKLLVHSSSKLPGNTDENGSLTPVMSKLQEKSTVNTAYSENLPQCAMPTSPRNTRRLGEKTAQLIPVTVSAQRLAVQGTQASAERKTKSKRQRDAPAADLECPASTAGILKNLQDQIKGLEPKDKLKYVFLKITDIENKIAVWADIKKELYQLVSYILEDEKSQSASSSHEENVSSEVEPETSRNPKRLTFKASALTLPSNIRLSRSNASSVPYVVPVRRPVDPDSECETTSSFQSKKSPKRKRKKAALLNQARKKRKNVKQKPSSPILAAMENEFIAPINVSSRPLRSVAKIKIESSSDNEDNISVSAPIGERSRSSKRNKSLVNPLSDSSPSPSPSKKRTCTRQSASNLDKIPIQSNSNSPLRKTKAELKQMVFFPKPPEKRTRRSSLSKTLNENEELRMTRRGKNIVVKEEIQETELIEMEDASLGCSPPLRDCSVVLQQLDQSKLQSNQPNRDITAVDTHSVSSSDDDDEIPLSILSRKQNVASPTASLQGDIDISSVSSSDTVSLKLNIACPKSMKNRMKKYGDQAEGSHHHHHHSSRHGPLEFAQHNQGTILDIKVVGKHVLAASEDGIVLSYSVKSGKLKKKYRGHSAAVTCLCIINSETEPFYPEKMVTGSIDGQLRSFILKTGEQIHAPLQVGESTAIDVDWGVIYLGTNRGDIAQVNTKTFTRVGDIFECSKEPIHALIATKEGPRKVLIVGSRNQAITVRDAETGLLLRSVSGGWQHTVYSLLLDNSLVYCGTKEGNVPAFDFTNGQQIFCLQAGNGVRCLKAYNGLLFAGCYDGFIYVFKGQTLVTKFAGGKMIISMDFTKNKVIFSSKDKLQALNFPHEVSVLLKESKMKKVL